MCQVRFALRLVLSYQHLPERVTGAEIIRLLLQHLPTLYDDLLPLRLRGEHRNALPVGFQEFRVQAGCLAQLRSGGLLFRIFLEEQPKIQVSIGIPGVGLKRRDQ